MAVIVQTEEGHSIASTTTSYKTKRQHGLRARVLEAGSDVGGSWYFNRYPGARTDSESWLYAFSISKKIQDNWDWSERFPGQPEALGYQSRSTRQELRDTLRGNGRCGLRNIICLRFR